MKLRFTGCVLAILCCAITAIAHADIYSAEAAYQKKDFAQAFELFREIAELGNPLAQETIAIMYVQGEGIARDNIRGYAWALLAKENGLGANVQPIIDQVGPRLSADGLKVVDEVQGNFGKAAIEGRWVPLMGDKAVAATAGLPKREGCAFKTAANPDNYYPRKALVEGVSGSVMVRVTIMSDGRARNPQVAYSVPPKAFDAAGRKVAHDSGYAPLKENGVVMPCVLRFRVRFSMSGSDFSELKKELVRLENLSDQGDPLSQFQFAMLKSSWNELNPERADFSHLVMKAAQAGLASAQYVVGIDAVDSRIPGNREKGIAWLERSAAAGLQDAQVALALDRMRGVPDADDVVQARELLEKAVSGGHEEGGYYLADLLNGETVPAKRDPARVAKLVDDAFVVREQDPSIMEVRAVALSQLGDFAGAIRLQTTAISNARRMHWDVAPMQERLALYEKNQPWVGRVLVY